MIKLSSGVTLPPASSPRTPATSNALHNAYEEKYLVAANATPGNNSADKSDLSNGIYGHELVSAISQITQHRRDDNSATSGSVNKTPTGKLRIDPWGGKVDDSSSLTSLQGERYGRVNSGGGTGSRYATSAALPPSSSLGGHPQDTSLIQVWTKLRTKFLVTFTISYKLSRDVDKADCLISKL